MSEDILIRIRSDITNAQQNIRQLQNEINSLRTAGRTNPFSGITQGAMGLGRVIGGLGIAFTALDFGRKAVELGKLGFEAQQTELALRGLAGGAAQAAQSQEAIVAASGKSLSNLEAQRVAASLLSGKIATTTTEMARFVEVWGTLGRTEGFDVEFSIDNAIRLLRNASVLRLDEAGLSAGLVKQRIAELAEEFPNLDRNTRFTMAAMEAAEARFETLSSAGVEVSSGTEQLSSAMSNLSATIGGSLAPALESSSSSLASFVTQIDEVLGKQALMSQMNSELMSSMEVGYTSEMDAFGADSSGLDYTEQMEAEKITELHEKFMELAEAKGILAEQALQLAEDMGYVETVTEELNSGFLELAASQEMTVQQAFELASGYEMLNASATEGLMLTAEGKIAFLDMAMAQGMSAEQATASASAYGILDAATSDLTGASGDAQVQFVELALQKGMAADTAIALGQTFGILGTETEGLTALTFQQQKSLIDLMVQSGMTAAESLSMAQKFGVSSAATEQLAAYAGIAESRIRSATSSIQGAGGASVATAGNINTLKGSMAAAETQAHRLANAMDRIAQVKQGRASSDELLGNAKASLRALEETTPASAQVGAAAWAEHRAALLEAEDDYNQALETSIDDRDKIRQKEEAALKRRDAARAELDPDFAVQKAQEEFDGLASAIPSRGNTAEHEAQYREAELALKRANEKQQKNIDDVTRDEQRAAKKASDEAIRQEEEYQSNLNRAQAVRNERDPYEQLRHSERKLAELKGLEPPSSNKQAWARWKADVLEAEETVATANERIQGTQKRRQNEVEKAQQEQQRAADKAQREAERQQQELLRNQDRAQAALNKRDPNEALRDAQSKLSSLKAAEPPASNVQAWNEWRADLLEAENSVVSATDTITKKRERQQKERQQIADKAQRESERQQKEQQQAADKAQRESERQQQELERNRERAQAVRNQRDPNEALRHAESELTDLQGLEPPQSDVQAWAKWEADMLEAEATVASASERINSEQERGLQEQQRIADKAQRESERQQQELERNRERAQAVRNQRDPNEALRHAESELIELQGIEPPQSNVQAWAKWEADMLEAEATVASASERITRGQERQQREQERIAKAAQRDAARQQREQEQTAKAAQREAERQQQEFERNQNRAQKVLSKRDPNEGLRHAESELTKLQGIEPPKTDAQAWAKWRADILEAEEAVASASKRITSEQERQQHEQERVAKAAQRDAERQQKELQRNRSRAQSILNKRDSRENLRHAQEELAELMALPMPADGTAAKEKLIADRLEAEEAVTAANNRLGREEEERLKEMERHQNRQQAILNKRDSNENLRHAQGELAELMALPMPADGTAALEKQRADIMEAEENLAAANERLGREEEERLKEMERHQNRQQAILNKRDSNENLQHAQGELAELMALPMPADGTAALEKQRADIMEAEENLTAAEDRIAREEEERANRIRSSQDEIDRILSARDPYVALEKAQAKLDKLRALEPPLADEGAWLEWRAEILKAEDDVTAAIDRTEKAAKDALKKVEKAIDDLKGVVDQSIDLDISVGKHDMLLEEFGLRPTAVNEAGRRLEDVIQQGLESPWINSFEELRGLSDKEARATAAHIQVQIDKFLRPDLLDKGAILQNARDTLVGQKNKEALVDELTEELVKEGWAEEDVEEALGTSMGDVGKNIGKDVGEDIVSGIIDSLGKKVVDREPELLATSMALSSALSRGININKALLPDLSGITLNSSMIEGQKEALALASTDISQNFVSSLVISIQQELASQKQQIVGHGSLYSDHFMTGLEKGVLNHNLIQALFDSFLVKTLEFIGSDE
ncbi:MAG: hypothetical protein ACPGWR_00980 [Ardenticatenaceae bacterium]